MEAVHSVRVLLSLQMFKGTSQNTKDLLSYDFASSAKAIEISMKNVSGVFVLKQIGLVANC